jgi:hypothetical protein
LTCEQMEHDATRTVNVGTLLTGLWGENLHPLAEIQLSGGRPCREAFGIVLNARLLRGSVNLQFRAE